MDLPPAPPHPTSTTPAISSCPPPDPPTAPKLRLMCSYGGHIVPRPHDKTLCYVGGETRIVSFPRGFSLCDLLSRLSSLLESSAAPKTFSVKYQLPNEDLDSLISVSNDEDLENLIDEYDRLLSSSSASKNSRLRLFLFPTRTETEAASVLEATAKSVGEDWFVSALNGSGGAVLRRGFSDPLSVNCLLGLDENDPNSGNSGNSGDSDRDFKGRLGKLGNFGNQDVSSVPDSPIVETSSSFGSTSSSPSLASLPRIRVHVEGRGARVRVSGQKIGGYEEGISESGVQVKEDEGFGVVASTGNIVSSDVAPEEKPSTMGVADGGYENRVVSDDERTEQDGNVGFRKPSGAENQSLVMVSSQSQQKLNGNDLASPDSVSSDNSVSNALSRQKPVICQEPGGQLPSSGSRLSANLVDAKVANASDPSIWGQIQQPSDNGYAPSSQYDLQHQLFQQQQQQFIQAAPHYAHHSPPTGTLPMSAYYPLYASQHPQLSHHQGQYPLYYIPAGPAQAYSLPVQQPSFADSANTVPATRPKMPAMISTSAVYSTTRNLPTQKSEMVAGVYRTEAGSEPPLVQVGSGQYLTQPQQQFVGYSQIHHPSQSMTATPFEYADPAHTQLYFSQPLQPPLAAQYQTLTSNPAMLSRDVSAQLPADNSQAAA